MPKKKELKSPKGRAKEIARQIEKKVDTRPPAQPDTLARLERMLGQLTTAILSRPEPTDAPEPALDLGAAPENEYAMLQREMGVHRAKNREWRDQEVLMSKIAHLEAFRDQAVHRLAVIEKVLASARRR